MTTTIEHTITLNASPARVYDALIDATKHAAFTGAPAEIEPNVGGSSSAYGGIVTAIHLDLVAGERIVQAWRSKTMRAGMFTLVTYALARDGEKTTLHFRQDAVPEADHAHLDQGWHERYWKPLAAYLDGRKDL